MATARSPFFRPTFAIPMAASVVLLLGFLIYYFPVTARQEAALVGRSLRTLVGVGDGVQSRVVAYRGVVEQAFKKGTGNGGTTAAFRAYLAEETPDFVVPTSGLTLTAGPCGATVTLRHENGVGHFDFRCAGMSLPVSVPVERMLTPYLLGEADRMFDEILVADADGTVVYQTHKSPARIAGLASLELTDRRLGGALRAPDPAPAPSASTPFSTATETTRLLSLHLGGTPHVMFLVPVPLKLTGVVPTGDRSRFLIGGLLRESRLRAESTAMPGAALTTAILSLLVIVVGSWPLLRFSYMAPTDHIPRPLSLVLGTLATIILLCVLAFHWRFATDTTRIDDHLTTLAAAIERNLDQELHEALQVIDSANDAALVMHPPSVAACTDELLSTAAHTRFPVTRLLAALEPRRRGLQLSGYPYFERIFWVDSRGNQHIKWEVGSQGTPPVYVGDRTYVTATVGGRLWQFANARRGSALFRVDPVVSRNTGDYRAVVSQRAPPALTVCTDAATGQAVTVQVVSMVTPLLSLIDPVMPPGYGFALVDEGGNSLFHSRSAKSGNENLLNEVDDAAELRMALTTRQPTHLSTRYSSIDTRMFITPIRSIDHAPWTLVVFSSLTAASGEHLGRIMLFGTLATVYFLLVSLAVVLAAGPRRTTRLWPHHGQRTTYLKAAAILVSIAPAGYMAIFDRDRAAGLLGAALLVVLGVAVARRAVAHRCATWRWHIWLAQRLDARVGVAATALGAVLLLLFGVLPTIALFKAAFDYSARLAVQAQQIQTVADLTAREERVKAQFAKVGFGPGGASQDSTARWLFIRRRLDQTLDRYDREFLSLGGQTFTAGAPGQCHGAVSPVLARIHALLPSLAGAPPPLLGSGAAVQSPWRWCREGSNRIRMIEQPLAADDDTTFMLPPVQALSTAVTGDPRLLQVNLLAQLPTVTPWPLATAAAVFVVLLALVFAWLRPILEQVFQLALEQAPPFEPLDLATDTVFTQPLILLAPNEIDAGAVLRHRTDLQVVDMAAVVNGTTAAIPGARTVVLEHFAHALDDAAANARRLAFLEGLQSVQGDPIVIILTTIDPIFYFGAGEDVDHVHGPEAALRSTDRGRWAMVLRPFVRRRVTAPDADPAPLVWWSCTSNEKLALYQLAHDGWVNVKNAAALAHLQRRGIIVGAPVRFVDERLRTFVFDATAANEPQAWAGGEGSVLDGVRLTFLVVALGTGAFLAFFNQQSTLGYVATAAGVLTPLTKLLTQADSFRSLLRGKTEEQRT